MNELLLSYSKFSSRTDVNPDTSRYIVTAVSFKGLGRSSEISADNEADLIRVRKRYEFLQHVWPSNNNYSRPVEEITILKEPKKKKRERKSNEISSDTKLILCWQFFINKLFFIDISISFLFVEWYVFSDQRNVINRCKVNHNLAASFFRVNFIPTNRNAIERCNARYQSWLKISRESNFICL